MSLLSQTGAAKEFIVIDGEDEQLADVKNFIARVGYIDPTTVQAYMVVILDKPLAGESPDECYRTIEIGGTNADKIFMVTQAMEKLNEILGED